MYYILHPPPSLYVWFSPMPPPLVSQPPLQVIIAQSLNHKVLLPVNQNYDKIWKTKEPSVKRLDESKT